MREFSQEPIRTRMNGKARMGFFLLLMFMALPVVASSAEIRTMDELVQAYDEESCKACHQKIYEEWTSSRHAHSVVSSLGILREFIVKGLGQDWKQPVTKDHLMRCMGCHAPQLKDASEPLVQEIARLVVEASDESNEARSTEAKKSLSRLNVNCIICHNTKAALERNLKGPPEAGVYYGPHGQPTQEHPTARSTALTSSLFCGQCHGIYTPPDGEIVFCSSLYESHQDAYRAGGKLQTCQDCHMRAKSRGHGMPGSHQVEMLQDGIVLEMGAVAARLDLNRWTPTVVVSAEVSNRAGHRTPDG